MPQLTLFGATGPTGKAFIAEALKRGYTLVVYARSPHKLDPELKENPKIRTVQGTLENYEAVLESLRGSSAAFILLAPNDGLPKWAGGNNKALTMTTGYINVMKALNALGTVNRLIGIGTPSAVDPRDGFNLGLGVLVPLLHLFAPKIYGDVVASGKALKEWEDKIQWSWIRVSFLFDGPSKPYKLGYVGQSGRFGLPSLARDELAKALLDELDTGAHIHQMPLVWS